MFPPFPTSFRTLRGKYETSEATLGGTRAFASEDVTGEKPTFLRARGWKRLVSDALTLLDRRKIPTAASAIRTLALHRAVELRPSSTRTRKSLRVLGRKRKVRAKKSVLR
jgi:hypothetical protein